MEKFILAVALLCSNYFYQYLQAAPDYMEATERAYFQAIAMLFIVWGPEIMGKYLPWK